MKITFEIKRGNESIQNKQISDKKRTLLVKNNDFFGDILASNW
jgi:hypothetical protein